MNAESKKRNFFVRCWHGEAKLWQAYWLIGVLSKIPFFALVGFIGWLLWKSPEDDLLVNSLLFPLVIAYITYVAVSVWRCAPNASHGVFTGLAKTLVVFYLLSWLLAFANTL
ncbi:MAG TPA: hypothetical protein VF268_13425 [Gammaproteobacteria bacterium]